MFPCAYILLTGKDTDINKLTLQELTNSGLNHSMPLAPKEILTGFELAIINAYGYFWPMAKIYGCWFLFGQSRKLQ